MLFDFVKNITAFLLFETVALHLVERSTYKKYLRFFFGIVLILIILGPVLTVFGVEGRLNEYLDSWDLQMKEEDMRSRMEAADESGKREVMSAYEKSVWDSVGQYAQSYGWYVYHGKITYREDYEVENVLITLSHFVPEEGSGETAGEETAETDPVVIDKVEIDQIFYDSESYGEIDSYKKKEDEVLWKGREEELQNFKREVSLLLGISMDKIQIETLRE